jgi:hypothetical protein
VTDLSQTETYRVVHGADAERKPVFSLLCKRTYIISSSGPLVRAEQASPLRTTDEYYDDGDPDSATIKHETDLVPFKPLTDVIVIAKAYAPQGRPVSEMDIPLLPFPTHATTWVPDSYLKTYATESTAFRSPTSRIPPTFLLPKESSWMILISGTLCHSLRVAAGYNAAGTRVPPL